MNQPFFVAWGVTLTAWKLVGYLGVALFAGRWFVQIYYSASRPQPQSRRSSTPQEQPHRAASGDGRAGG